MRRKHQLREGREARAPGAPGAAVALLRLGICDGSQSLRRLGRANFRLAAARLPAVVELVRVRFGRFAVKQLASVHGEELADAAALRAADAAKFAGAPLEPAILIAAVREAATRVEDARRALGGAA